MWPWILILMVSAIAQVCKSCYMTFGRGRKFSISILLVFALLFLFRAFRKDYVGGDLETYKSLFYFIGTKKWNEGIYHSGYEIGFLIYLKLIYSIIPNFNVVLVTTAIIYTYALVYFIYSFSPNPEFSLYIYIALYFLGSSFNNERQAISIAFLLISFKYIKYRKVIYFTILVIIACLFHMTSIVFFPVYFLYNIKMTQKIWIISGLVAIMVCALAPVILNFIITHVYTKYIGVDLKGGGGYMYFMLLALTLGAGVLLLSKDELINKPDVNLWVKMMLIAATMQIFSFTMGYFFRLVILYSVAIIVFIPIGINKLHGPSKAIAKMVISIMLFGYYLFELTHDTLNLVPYAWRL